jgi:hypothetical protein
MAKLAKLGLPEAYESGVSSIVQEELDEIQQIFSSFLQNPL